MKKMTLIYTTKAKINIYASASTKDSTEDKNMPRIAIPSKIVE